MQKDIRDTDLYREIEDFYTRARRPASGLVNLALEPNASPDGRHAVFSGSLTERLIGGPTTRICEVELETGALRILSFGPNTDRLPKYAPSGALIAFLSDRAQAGDFQLHLLDRASGETRPTPKVAGWVEYLQWSPDGQRILLGVAGHGADVAGGQGAIASKQKLDETPPWTPRVETRDEAHRWRSLWVHDLSSGVTRALVTPGLNIWEASWCGDHAIAAITSLEPGEGAWYGAKLTRIDLESGAQRELYAPEDQISLPVPSPSGDRIALIEAVCSDRGIAAGDVRVIDKAGRAQSLDTKGVDVTSLDWRSQRSLLVAGHRGFASVVGFIDVDTGRFEEIWVSEEYSPGARYATVSGLPKPGECVFIAESFLKGPELAIVREGRYQRVRSFDFVGEETAGIVGEVRPITWAAPDGLDIQGWLLRPRDASKNALIVNVHGGPVWQWHPMWLGRPGHVHALMLLKHGYSVFMPNPRGSTGRGQDFARRIVGDMCGADTQDYLSGLDYLVAQGLADPKRIGVTGGSYGGLMASWLITQDTRFAAAVPWAPVTNYIAAHFTSNIPHFVSLFLNDAYDKPNGRYLSRSPLMHARKVKTPTLNMCGALDRCTPPTEAEQFHNALLEAGVNSVLVTYPQEGHGVRHFPAAIDFAARVVSWFETYMPAR